jgi:hypothetical protein
MVTLQTMPNICRLDADRVGGWSSARETFGGQREVGLVDQPLAIEIVKDVA